MAPINISTLGSVTSDKIYSPQKGTGNFNLIRDAVTAGTSQKFRDSITGLSYEVEYNNKYIAFTYKYTTSTNTSVTGRFAWAGNFSYGKDSITSANVTSLGIVTATKPNTGSTTINGSLYKPNKGNVNDPFQSLPQLISKSTSLGSYQSDGIPGVTAGDISPFRSFGEKKFFYSGWESNPFNSNLI
jgi:hypothetical protein